MKILFTFFRFYNLYGDKRLKSRGDYMLLLTIINNSHKDYVLNEIRNIITYLEDKELELRCEVDEEDGCQLVEIYGEISRNSEANVRIFQYYIATILYKVAVKEFLDGKINKHLNEAYNFLNYKDISIVEDVVHKVLNEEVAIDETMIFCMNRKNDALQKIMVCLSEVEELNVKGFLDFRSKDLNKDIISMVEKIVEKYMIEKEYNEFINLLKYFVEVQDCKLERVDLFIGKSGDDYTLKDDEGNDMMESLLNDLCENKTMGEISKDDLIISGLITTCPHKIVIHSSERCKNKELIKTIHNVFESRVEYCTGCNECNILNGFIKIPVDNNINI